MGHAEVGNFDTVILGPQEVTPDGSGVAPSLLQIPLVVHWVRLGDIGQTKLGQQVPSCPSFRLLLLARFLPGYYPDRKQRRPVE